ncbi:sialate O-acetylesterase [Tenacibaculum sp. MAR_2009_124]|uniref:sialate O-acetylesterase n=1 Tax=Tenacibaculum sp. MAR_2009_124 TaxID=1250059 RepID=UPI000B85D50C|nr:sialate O-acetylesterase [Tenacibaculum sp. MAR_2009_124]
MQGERDARKNNGEVYEQSLLGLYKQLSEDLNRADINFVIGRISDFGLKKKKWTHWKMIREVQMKVAESNPRFDWVNTDDLNTGRNRKGQEIKDNIHMSANGYVVMGGRFADKAIKLIESNK